MSDTGSVERDSLRWVIQTQVSDTGSGEWYRLGWARQTQVSETDSGEPLVINKNSYVQLPVSIHLINVNNKVYWLHRNYIVHVYLKMHYIYSFIQYYKTIEFVFCYLLSYCTAGFHIERYLIYFSGVRNPGKILKFTSRSFSTSVAIVSILSFRHVFIPAKHYLLGTIVCK